MSGEEIGDTIVYDVKPCQVKTTIVNFTAVQLKGLKIFNISHNICWYSQQVCDSTIPF